MSTATTIEQRWSGFASKGWEGVIDGARFVVERGLEGDHRFVHGAPPDRSGVPSTRTRAVHHLSRDARMLCCAPSNPSDIAWWRLVLDSVLFTVALLRGHEALHAGAIATPSGAIAITAPSGGGKSTLLAELLGRGHKLMADDVLVLDSQGAKTPLAHPAPPVMTVSAQAGQPRIPEAQIISLLDGERWIEVPVWPTPLPVKALVVLDRRADADFAASITKIESPLAPLLDSLMSFPKTPERERARFVLASALATEATAWRLTASVETPPDVLADVLLAGAL